MNLTLNNYRIKRSHDIEIVNNYTNRKTQLSINICNQLKKLLTIKN